MEQQEQQAENGLGHYCEDPAAAVPPHRPQLVSHVTDLSTSCGRPRPRVPKVTPAVRAKVVDLRFRRKMKQTDIAAAVGISQASVARILAENERESG